ncbi:MAG: hypothetical protein A3C53_04280 [Omnitrophica WOR_2 bacterium RIFCSPHIGHO2_02_FULL_68_15]|nr:MAG: hypothetical protein A3C53_04280 [Omnitrophica WOR_2 bacterium RIFCSPHIGHO2_02_FULL_68_15]
MAAVPSPAAADTIYLKEKKSLKGVVVDEHADRYILNTVDGEVEVLKAVVEAVKYDDPELSYYQLGRQFQRAGRLRDAYQAYQYAAQLRPDFQAARDAAFNVQRLLSRQDESQIVADVQKQQLIFDRAGRPAHSPLAGAMVPKPPAAIKTFEERFGCRLRYAEGQALITQVHLESLAGLAGLLAGDTIVAIWNDPVRHLSPDAMSQRLNESRGELALTVERTVIGPTQGVQVVLGYDGLRVTMVPDGVRGLAVNDLILLINDQSARYLDLAAAKRLLGADTQTTCVVQRAILLRERLPQ